MGKRKQGKARNEDDDGDGESDNESLINVDFDFFDPNPKVDYLALKRLIIQLFQGDAESLIPNALADLILSQPLLGSTVKTDGIESDPLAYLSVLNMHVHQKNESIAALRAYILSKSSASSALHSTLETLLGPEGLQSQNHLAFVFSERLINMPVQVIPHMYRMLGDEIQWANDENEPYTFTHYLFITRTYRLTDEEMTEMEASAQRQPPSKRPKSESLPSATPTGTSFYSYHPEDASIQKHASHVLDYALNALSSDSGAPGPQVGGRMMLVPAANFQPLIQEMLATYSNL